MKSLIQAAEAAALQATIDPAEEEVWTGWRI